MHECMCVFMYVCMYVSMHVCMLGIHVSKAFMHVCMQTMHAYMCCFLLFFRCCRQY